MKLISVQEISKRTNLGTDEILAFITKNNSKIIYSKNGIDFYPDYICKKITLKAK